MHKYLLLMTLIFSPLSFGITPNKAADEVLAQEDKSSKCQVF